MCYERVTRGKTAVAVACVCLSFVATEVKADGYADYYGNGMARIMYEPSYYSAYAEGSAAVAYSGCYREPLGSISVLYSTPRHQYRSIRPCRTEHRRHYYRVPRRGHRPRYYYFRDRRHDWSRDHIRPVWGHRRPHYRWQPHHGRRHSHRGIGSRHRWPGHRRHGGGFSIRIGR
jgi:hypothetical protein